MPTSGTHTTIRNVGETVGPMAARKDWRKFVRGEPVPRIEGNFNIGRIVVEDGDYLTLRREKPEDVLYYVSDKGNRYKIECPVEGEVQRENWTDYVLLAPVESAAVA